MTTRYYADTSEPLDRSPSLSSNSSGASSSKSAPITPHLPPASSFPSLAYKDEQASPYAPLSNASNNPRTRHGSIAGLAAFARAKEQESGAPSPPPTRAAPLWTTGHRAGAGSQSFDAARSAFGPVRSLSTRANLSGISSPTREEPTPAGRASPVGNPDGRSDSSTSRPTSTTPSSRPYSPISISNSPTRRSPSPTRPQSAYPSTATNRIPASPATAHSRSIASSIFASRDGSVAPSSSGTLTSGLDRSVVGSVRGFSRGHKRAMTLPQLGAAGLPVPAENGAGEEVAGLPGRLRLSRPVDAPSSFAPSAVFSSSHGLNRLAGSSTAPSGSLLPSQTVRAMDRERQDLVAYEYLCHVAEAKDWLTANIAPNAAEALETQHSISEFEQSLRNGYAIAHLARKLGGYADRICNEPVLQFRHTDNINIFFKFVQSVDLPEIFRFETADLYGAKNLPKVIYCLHALSHLLSRNGMAQGMQDLVGRIQFTDAEVNATQNDLNNAGVRMPNFKGLGKAFKEPEPETEQQRQDRLLQEAAPGIIGLQAHARGAVARRDFAARQRRRRAQEAEQRRLAEEDRLRQEQEQRQIEAEEHRRAEEERSRLEAEERRRAQEEARLVEQARLQGIEDARLRHAEAVRQAGVVLVGFQAVARGELARRALFAKVERVGDHELAIVQFQSRARGALARKRYDALVNDLGDAVLDVVAFQAVIRSVLARRRLLDRIDLLRSMSETVVGVQAQIRGLLARQAFANKQRYLRRAEVVRSVNGIQSLARAALTRRRVDVQRKELGFVEPDVVAIQAQVRGYLGRQAFLAWQQRVHGNTDQIVRLQAYARGALARRRIANIRQRLQQNLGKFVQLQATIRSSRQGAQYRQLRMGTNVQVNTIKNFVRLLDDSEFDYREELQVEALRKQLVREIRDTQTLEDDVKDLDTKIALLVKNKITHEVARAQQRAATSGLGANVRNTLLAAANDPFAPNVLDRHTQRKLELYQQLFALLQTSPEYLSRLLTHTSRSSNEKAQRSVESTVFVVFGYAQNQREEFFLLKLIQRSIQEELRSTPDLATFVRANFPFTRLLVQYGRGVNQRKYLKDFLEPWVRSIVNNLELDFECSPLELYRADIAAEETYTGRKSARPVDVTYQQAIGDENTKKVVISHFISLRTKVDEFLKALFSSTQSMPFGVRYVAREVFHALRSRFAKEPEVELLRVVANIVYYRFIQPAAVAPETFDIIEGVVPAAQRKNLGDACKLLNQISVGRQFSDDFAFMKPMNPFIVAKSREFLAWIRDVINVEDAESYFRADQYLDAASPHPPVIYISPNAVYATHTLIGQSLDAVAPNKQDPLRAILIELGGVPASSDAELVQARAEEVALTLTSRLREDDDPETKNKALFNEVKRRVLAILKVHHGNDLEAVLAQPVTDEDEAAWEHVVYEEVEEERRQAQQQGRRIIAPAGDIRNMSFHNLKHITIRDVMTLRKAGLVDRGDKYQAILNAIAVDIKSKRHRRIQRQHELGTMQGTLASLRDKKTYLDDQKRSYNDYIRESMASIQKKGKRRLVLPWSMQAAHERKLDRTGKRFQYGSYKYSAQDLYDRGILLSIDAYSPKQFHSISLTISSNEVGIFEITATALGLPVATVEMKLEDLLEMQFVGKQTVSIGGVAKANLNLLIHQINKKFYSSGK